MFQIKDLRPREQKANVSFLKKHSTSNVYSYPDIPDESLVGFEEIQSVLPEPRFDRRGHFFFFFWEIKFDDNSVCFVSAIVIPSITDISYISTFRNTTYSLVTGNMHVVMSHVLQVTVFFFFFFFPKKNFFFFFFFFFFLLFIFFFYL